MDAKLQVVCDADELAKVISESVRARIIIQHQHYADGQGIVFVLPDGRIGATATIEATRQARVGELSDLECRQAGYAYWEDFLTWARLKGMDIQVDTPLTVVRWSKPEPVGAEQFVTRYDERDQT